MRQILCGVLGESREDSCRILMLSERITELQDSKKTVACKLHGEMRKGQPLSMVLLMYCRPIAEQGSFVPCQVASL
jgi:hypothetical protein